MEKREIRRVRLITWYRVCSHFATVGQNGFVKTYSDEVLTRAWLTFFFNSLVLSVKKQGHGGMMPIDIYRSVHANNEDTCTSMHCCQRSGIKIIALIWSALISQSYDPTVAYVLHTNIFATYIFVSFLNFLSLCAASLQVGMRSWTESYPKTVLVKWLSWEVRPLWIAGWVQQNYPPHEKEKKSIPIHWHINHMVRVLWLRQVLLNNLAF